MDLLSYMLLGAVVGGFLAVRKIGNRALITGAIIAAIPCLDNVIARAALYFGSSYSDSFFHSILFILIASPIVAWILSRLRPNSPYSLAKRCVLVFWVLVSHTTLDIFSISGAQIFAPFSSQRIALAAIAPFDLILLLLLFISVVVVLIVKQPKLKNIILWCSLFFTALYFTFSVINKLYIKTEFEHFLQQHNLPHSRVGVFPIAGSSFNWNCLAQNHNTYWQSNFSNVSKQEFNLNLITQNNHLIDNLKNDARVNFMKKTTNDFYNIKTTDSTLLLHDVRYIAKNSNAQIFFTHTFVFTTLNSEIQTIAVEKTNAIIPQSNSEN